MQYYIDCIDCIDHAVVIITMFSLCGDVTVQCRMIVKCCRDVVVSNQISVCWSYENLIYDHVGIMKIEHCISTVLY